MSQDAEKTKALVNFKKKLEKKIEELESELKETQATLETVNSILLEKGFKRVEITKEAELAESVIKEALPSMDEVIAETEKHLPKHSAETESVIPLRTVNDDLLAIIYVNKDCVHVLPDESKHFNVNTPPFSPFLVERVLVKMQEKDNEMARMGQLTPDKMFSFNIIREGDLIREIVIKNVDADRLRELKSSIRWTLEKMYEKMKS